MHVPGEVCRDFAQSSKLEWLETNGTGAFAMGTVAGVNTRRYHGILVASLHPPVERYVLLSRMEEETTIDGLSYTSGVGQYPGAVTPKGYRWIAEFSTPPATWRVNLGGVTVEKQIYLIDGKQAAVIRYRPDRDLAVRVRPFLAYRDYHSLGRARQDVYGALPRIEFKHDGEFLHQPDWYYNNEYLRELDRGLDFREDLFTPGVITLHLRAGEWSPIVASIEPAEYAAPVARPEPFTVRRADGSPTVIAGYPWFTDWGRDTMISLPGLLALGKSPADYRDIVGSFLGHLWEGLIPNRFPDQGQEPEYNTADATLWMFQAVRALNDKAFIRDRFYPAAKEIIACHRRGTRFDIGVDPQDRLLHAGNAATNLTWMDARIGDRAITPRAGKPVEINALWHAALRLMAEWAQAFGDVTDFDQEAGRVRENFRAKFWNPQRECLYDVLGNAQLRPNQIFAVSLGFDLLESAQQQAVVRIVERELLTPVGLRTLERGDPEYCPSFAGTPADRDRAYHQGTVWPWLLGPFIDAYLIAFGRGAENIAYCRGLIEALEARARQSGCPDSIAEIYDGDEPHEPRGCPAQAWSVAEAARVKAMLA
ncbi:MAG TPA: amylo-alpha-1,6-glucosidase [Bryobacteraceae bacterium]|nr:amylo-alpha-1,6-glucosidase [Bryobacteraceae bacterium]